MAAGISGNGLYGDLRSRQQDKKSFEYELFLIEDGVRSPKYKKKWEKALEEVKEKISKINKEIKLQKQNK